MNREIDKTMSADWIRSEANLERDMCEIGYGNWVG